MINLNKLDLKNIPKHVAIIMDGNGRWAQEKGKKRFFGHLAGVQVVKKIVKCAISLKIQHLTLFAFSKENWRRPKLEVNMLMDLFVSTIKENQNHFLKNKIKIQIIGSINDLPKKCQFALKEIVEVTKDNNT